MEATKKDSTLKKPKNKLNTLFYLVVFILDFSALSLFVSNPIAKGHLSAYLALLAVFLSFIQIDAFRKSSEKKLGYWFCLNCFVVGISYSIDLNFIGFNITSFITNILTVIGIIASAALLLGIESRKKQENVSLSKGFFASGALSLFAVLLGIFLLFPYNSINGKLYVITLIGLLLGCILFSFSLLFILIIVFGTGMDMYEKKTDETKNADTKDAKYTKEDLSYKYENVVFRGEKTDVLELSLIDTGATISIIPRVLVEKIGAKIDGETSSYIVETNKIEKYPTCRIEICVPSLKDGGKFIFMVREKGDRDNKPIIGMNILKSLGIIINTKNYELYQDKN